MILTLQHGVINRFFVAVHSISCIYAYCGLIVKCSNSIRFHEIIGLTHLQTLAKSTFKQNYVDDIRVDQKRLVDKRIEKGRSHGAIGQMDKITRLLE